MHLQNKPMLIFLLLGLGSLLIAGLSFRHLVEIQQIIALVNQAGLWGRLVFLLAYVAATLLILPSTAFNLASGAVYGVWEGLILTTIGGLISAVIAFVLSRRLGQAFVESRLSGSWQDLSQQLQDGGLPYTFASRLFPIIPYGVVSFVAGLSQIRLRDYVLGTLLGTPFGNIPFVWLGSSGIQALSTRRLLPLILSGSVLATLVVLGTWYQQHRATSVNPVSTPED